MSPSLPSRPDLHWLKNRAKERLAELRASNPAAKLADAQKDVARAYGFPAWRALKAHVDAARAPKPPQPLPTQDDFADQVVKAFFHGVGTGQLDAVRAALDRVPALANAVGPHPFWGGRPQSLHVAVETRRREMVELLLEHGADPSGSNDAYGGWSPLMLAQNRKAPEIRDELLRRGARVGLVEALMLGDDARAEALLGSGLPDDPVPNEGSLLAFARTPWAIDRLIALGAAPDRADCWGTKPIEALSRLGAAGAPLVQHMIDRGIPAGPTELARLGDLRRLAELVEVDPAVTQQDAVLLGAVDFSHHDLVEWLLAHGANANARTGPPSRHTALHAAAWNGDLRMAQLLVASGADLGIRDAQYDATAQGWAETSIEVTGNARCTEIAAYLATRNK